MKEAGIRKHSCWVVRAERGNCASYGLAAEFEENVVVVNGDEFRSLHPRYRELHVEFGEEWVSKTAVWSGKMTEAVIDAFSNMGYNLIIEGTLRTSEVPLRTERFLRNRGYEVGLALLAVKPEISLISCQIRYEEMRIGGTIPRSTDPEHHWKIVEGIADNLATLETSGEFDSIRLFDRQKTCLFDSAIDGGEASEALRKILFGPWSDEEVAHFAVLQARLEQLRGC